MNNKRNIGIVVMSRMESSRLPVRHLKNWELLLIRALFIKLQKNKNKNVILATTNLKKIKF